MSAPNPRRLAAQVIHRVLDEGAWSNLALDSALAPHPEMDSRDRGLATELVYGTLTWKASLEAVLERFVKKGLHRLDGDVRAILLVALYQIIHLDRVPERAAVDEAVKAARKLHRGPALPGFVNGVLRAALRERARWPSPPKAKKDMARHLAAAWSLPLWLAQRLVRDFGPQQAQELAQALTQRPSLHLRAVGDREALAQALQAQPLPLSPAGLVAPGMSQALTQAIEQGQVTIQDEAAQLVSLLAQPAPGARVLDACAGLGGKALHLAQLAGPQGQVVAVEPHQGKLDALQKAFARHGQALERAVCADLRQVDAEQLGGLFDVVVVDAPCSGLGVLRRHPEARWTRQESDIEALVKLQGELLEAAQALVKPGQVLVYSVCTFTPEEGPRQIERLLERSPGWTLEAPDAGQVPWESLQAQHTGAYRAMPHQHGCDGFYLARLRAPGQAEGGPA